MLRFDGPVERRDDVMCNELKKRVNKVQRKMVAHVAAVAWPFYLIKKNEKKDH